MKQITPNLWFDHNAQEAVDFYLSVFPDSKVIATSYYPEENLADFQKEFAGKALTIDFELSGNRFTAINAGPEFKFTPAISFIVVCDTKEEVNNLWAKLSEEGKVLMELGSYPFSEWYGWTNDKHGVSWQIILDDKHYKYKHKITPTLMFVGPVAGRAEEAMNFYVSVFPESKVGDMARYPEGMAPDKAGTVMHGAFFLGEQEFFAMDSAQKHDFNFNESISLSVPCKDQKEIDSYWEKLSNVKESEQCGWCKDKYGLSWQIGPGNMEELMKKPGAFAKLMQMHKIDIAGLK